MKKKPDRRITRIMMAAGILLVVMSAAAVFWMQMSQHSAQSKLSVYTDTLQNMMPPVTAGVPDDREDTEMPVVEVDGMDFSGLLELPAYGKILPVYSKWEKGKSVKMPCRYTGSMYDGSLIIGSNDNAGQFDIAKRISGGDKVTFTDMTGLCYNYVVTDVYKTRDVSTANLQDDGADLVIFVKMAYSRDYMMIKCNIKRGQ